LGLKAAAGALGARVATTETNIVTRSTLRIRRIRDAYGKRSVVPFIRCLSVGLKTAHVSAEGLIS
jgi:hypothetical protein